MYSKLNSSISKTEIINLSEALDLAPATKLNPNQITKELKVIYNLKTLVIIDSDTSKEKISNRLVTTLNKFTEVGIKPSKILVVAKIKQFENEYPVFVPNLKVEECVYSSLNIPLLIFDSKDVQASGGIKELKIYLHSTTLYQSNQNKNPNFYF